MKPWERDGSTGFTDYNGRRICTGSQMGRSNSLPDDINEPVELRLERLNWVDGDYDEGGAYWGQSTKGEWIFCAHNDDGVEVYVRGTTMQHAADAVEVMLPGAVLTWDVGDYAALDTFTRHYCITALWNSIDTHDNMRRAAVDAGCRVFNGGGPWIAWGPKSEHLAQEPYESDAWESAYHALFGPGEPDEALDAHYGPEDIAPKTLAHMREDCERFQRENAADLALAYGSPEYQSTYGHHKDGDCLGGIESLAGHDFRLSRVGAGTGFWDRGDQDFWDRLHEAARAYAEVYLGAQDGKIYD